MSEKTQEEIDKEFLDNLNFAEWLKKEVLCSNSGARGQINTTDSSPEVCLLIGKHDCCMKKFGILEVRINKELRETKPREEVLLETNFEIESFYYNEQGGLFGEQKMKKLTDIKDGKIMFSSLDVYWKK